ncbi:HlyD family secretion protein [Francisella sp. Scap27]|uniref:HlyD family secretion protein n=1 Tax=Francisella sp. Scap27 TaxID=2589986 RepID=UPI0015C0558E|nr:HlyD family secretion protein [Francisella sp. Scap27]QLE78991.1 HlyD family secretion protein [Francisella sp. Scap27]
MKFKVPKNKLLSQVERSPVRKNIAKWQWYSVVAVVVAPLVYIVWLIFSGSWFIVAHGTVVTEKYLIRANEDSFVEQNFIHDGEIIKKGGQVFKLKSPLLETELKEINDQIHEIESMQEKLYNKDLSAINHMYNTSKKYVDINKKFYEAMVDLRKEKVINLVDLQKSSQVLHDAEMELERVKVDKQEYSLDKDSEYEKDIRDLEFRKAIVEKKLDSLDIKMNIRAVVNKAYVYKGEFVQKGQELAMLSLFSKPYIRAYLDSKYLSYVHRGTAVTIRFQDGVEFSGKVDSQPIFAEVNRDSTSIFDEVESKVVIIVKPTEEIPSDYNINSVPVEIDIDRL